MSNELVHSRTLVLEPQKGSPWADEMVLNPAIIQDPQSHRIHMLFRATGPWPQKQIPGHPLPYPIFLGYAFSEDGGKTWEADFSRPALAPALQYEYEDIYVNNGDHEKVVNYSNGCIEDPRLFFLEGECFVIVACRLMPPGPYWIHDEPSQCAPLWIKTEENPFGKAASENVTVNVLYKVDLALLSQKKYEEAFEYVIHLTDPEMGEDRDVVLFPEKLMINGKRKYVCLHRPFVPKNYPGINESLPSIFICSADNIKDLWNETATQTVLASPLFNWEGDRIGASTTPLRISDKEWLLCYHGKQDAVVGYTQSFMILEEKEDSFPVIKHRCSDRLMFAKEPWELPNRFKTPCVFITGLIKLGAELLISYGAADEKAGIARIPLDPLISFLRTFDAQGRKIRL